MIPKSTSLALLALLLVGCQSALGVDTRRSDVREAGGLSLTLSASRAQIAPGDTVRLVAKLTNGNAAPVRIDFSSGCQVLFYVENAAGAVVHPSGGGWGCTAALTSLELRAGETREFVHAWTGQTEEYDAASRHTVARPLPAGTYHAQARLDGRLGGSAYALRSTRAAIAVR